MTLHRNFYHLVILILLFNSVILLYALKIGRKIIANFYKQY